MSPLHKIMLSQVKEFFLIPQLPEFQAMYAHTNEEKCVMGRRS